LGLATTMLIVMGLVLLNNQVGNLKATFGETLVLRSSDAQMTGITQVTVYGIRYPVSGERYSPAPPGYEYALATVRGCAGQSGSQYGLDPLTFGVMFPDGQSVAGVPDLLRVKQRPLNVGALTAGQCESGYIAFQIAKGTTPDAVDYAPDGLDYRYDWSATP